MDRPTVRVATAILRAMRVMLCTARDALRYVHRAVRRRRRRKRGKKKQTEKEEKQQKREK